MELSKKERIKMACRNQMPDRVPVAPDISNMVPCRLTGKKFWEIYITKNPPLWKAYIDAANYFDMEIWLSYGILDFTYNAPIEIKEKIEKNKNYWLKRTTYYTPKGELQETMYSPEGNFATYVEKVVKNFKEDFEKLKYLFTVPDGYDDSIYKQQVKDVGDNGMIAVSINPPGFQNFLRYFNGNLETMTYAYYDYPELFEELTELAFNCCIKKTILALECGVESILTGGSGSLTLQGPELFRKLSLPAIIEQTKLCKQNNVISGIHSCGREMFIVDICARETDLDYINPLEIAPMGDCSLAECKKKYGNRLALMGNIHTIDIMLRGSEKDVVRESLSAMLDAGENGGFILSTGDQCGRDTPDENIRAMINTAKIYGKYPLDMDFISQKLATM